MRHRTNTPVQKDGNTEQVSRNCPKRVSGFCPERNSPSHIRVLNRIASCTSKQPFKAATTLSTPSRNRKAGSNPHRRQRAFSSDDCAPDVRLRGEAAS